ncbi:hypothetical protein MASR1M36_00590 [Candidatus Cloacimonadaceae bacterium]
MNIFFSFIGGNDRNCIIGKSPKLGPIGSIMRDKMGLFDQTVLFLDPTMRFRDGIDCQKLISPFYKGFYHNELTIMPLPEIKNPANHQEIYNCLFSVFADYDAETKKGKPRFFFNLSSGTPAMHAILMLFGKARYEAVMYQSYEKEGKEFAEEVKIPFPITLETISREIKAEASLVQEALHREPEDQSIIGNHPIILDAKARTAKYALCDFNILITGESGTGKELFARYYHRNNPTRSKKEIVCENCANFPENLIESELFGHVKGAFTGAETNKAGSFERANKGVLFLDEIGEMPLILQARLLRVLETGMIRPVGAEKERKVDVRIVAATNSPEKLRPDLRYRLADGIIDLPPLRKRGEDVLAIAESIIGSTNKDLARRMQGYATYSGKNFDESAKRLLLTHNWMGNVRELISVIRRACALESEAMLTDHILQKHMFSLAKSINVQLTLPFNPECEIVINQPIDLMNELKQIKKHVLHSKQGAFKTKQKMAEFFGFEGSSALNKHL